MIITFTGTQSVGKSTLLSALQKDERYKDWMFEPEITRSLKEKFGLNINESGDSITQLFVLNSHLENVVKHKNNNVILDRCIVDGLVYTTYQYMTGKIHTDVFLHAKYMFDLIIDKYDIIFHIEPEFPVVDDGVRSIDEKFRTTIASLINEALQSNSVVRTKIVKLTGTVEERLKQIDIAIENLKAQNII
jgi:nicotinamide riboside kinase